jgi:hypothetical protein
MNAAINHRWKEMQTAVQVIQNPGGATGMFCCEKTRRKEGHRKM